MSYTHFAYCLQRQCYNSARRLSQVWLVYLCLYLQVFNEYSSANYDKMIKYSKDFMSYTEYAEYGKLEYEADWSDEVG